MQRPGGCISTVPLPGGSSGLEPDGRSMVVNPRHQFPQLEASRSSREPDVDGVGTETETASKGRAAVPVKWRRQDRP